MFLVLHVSDGPAQICVDGHSFNIPPNEVFEVPEIRGTDNGKEYVTPDHLVGKLVLQHAWYHGIVEVQAKRTRGGITFDEDAAREDAEIRLAAAEDQLLERYVHEQQERASLPGFSALAPSGRVAAVITKRGIDIAKDYNLNPPGYGAVAKMSARDVEFNTLKKEHEETKRQLDETQRQFRELMARMDDAAGGKKTK